MTRQWLGRPALLVALILSIPAFYLALSGSDPLYHNAGRLLYAAVALILTGDLGFEFKRTKHLVGWRHKWHRYVAEFTVLFGAIASALRTDHVWSDTEWLLRLALVGVVFVQLSVLLSRFVAPKRLTQILAIAAGVLAIAGGGFSWLEPSVHSYADGLWLAFTTVSTVGYGDIVPSTPASRVFAMFIVLLGYALFSIVTASIAALFIGEDEKRLQRELHADIRALRQEVAALREELHHSTQVPGQSGSDVGKNSNKY